MARPKCDVDPEMLVEKPLLLDQHKAFLLKFSKTDNPTTHYLKMSGIYWCLTALDLVDSLQSLDKNEILNYVQSCKQSDGGYSPYPSYHSHILYVLSAVQVLHLIGEQDKLDKDAISKYIKALQLGDGSFMGDNWGEVDTRFCFCAIATLALLNLLPRDSNNVVDLDGDCVINLRKLTQYLVSCQNIDGGFGTRPGGESHGGQAYCVIGALSILGKLNCLNVDNAAWWLAERQLISGGLNGRPEKYPDVCYSWWVLASLAMLGRLEWIHADDLSFFILASQDDETGGISDRPGNYPDPFHTLFGLAGLSMLSHENSDKEKYTRVDGKALSKASPQLVRDAIKRINPVYCMPEYLIAKLNPPFQIIKH